MWSTDPERSVVTVQRTVGFVDLVGYTTATASLSLRELTHVLVEFDLRTSEIVAEGGGQIVKTIGDEAMFVTEDAGDACRIALELIDAAGGTLPPVRVGLATGEMASVFGDLYGPDVNLAARLVGAAEPATALVSEQVRAAAGDFRFARAASAHVEGLRGTDDGVQGGARLTVRRRDAVAGTAVVAVALMGWGATRPPIDQGRSPVPPPAVLPVRVVVLDPASGAVIWSSVTMPTHVVLDPATGRPVTAGASTSAP